MKVIDHIRERKSTLFSFEILPPLKGRGIDAIYEGIDPLLEFNPSFINVTYHREEFVYKKEGDQLLRKVSVKKRPGTVGICAAVANKYEIDTVPHMICGGFNREDTENALIDLHFLGIDNVLVLRGDPIKSESHFVAEPNGHKYAVDLIKQVVALNQGHYIHDETENSSPTDFCIGCAGYPEKHYEALNLKTDLHYLRDKIKAGAEYVTTQMFFDNAKYFAYVDRCREMGIDVPIIAGLKPITNLKQISFLPNTFFIDFPEELADQLMRCKTDNEVREVGVEWCIRQSRELIERGVPCIHYYTMGKSEAVRTVAREVY